MNLHEEDIYQSVKAPLCGNIMDSIAHNQIILNTISDDGKGVPLVHGCQKYFFSKTNIFLMPFYCKHEI